MEKNKRAETEEETYAPELQPCEETPVAPPSADGPEGAYCPYKSEQDKQEEHYTAILEAFGAFYKKKSRRNHVFKAIFFFAILALLVVLTAGFATACVLLALKGQDWTITVPVAAAGAATVLSALVTLPQIIATHLFPTDEDRVIVDLIKVLKADDDIANAKA